MRTLTEISEKIKKLAKDNSDFFGFQRNELINYLSFEQVKTYLRDDVCSYQWTRSELTHERVVEEMLDYMKFAWEKANNCRGLSAGLSVGHYEVWLWLLEDDLGEKLEAMYQYYGKPCLRAVCEKYNWDWRQWDDGEWRNSEDGPAISPPSS